MNRTHPDFSICDTNGDGVLDNRDDPYGPYWPGDDVVDCMFQISFSGLVRLLVVC
jgi:hypothetical protein